MYWVLSKEEGILWKKASTRRVESDKEALFFKESTTMSGIARNKPQNEHNVIG